MAFVVARFSFKFNLALLGFFLAANLLPPQALLIPVYRMFRAIQVPFWFSDSGTLLNSYWALILVNIAFQTGLLRLRAEQLHEDAARASSTSRPRSTGRRAAPVLPAHPAAVPAAARRARHPRGRPGSTTSSSGRPCCCRRGDKFPITSSLNNLRGQFFTDNNLVAAGSVIVALPTLVIFFVLQSSSSPA